MIHSIVVQYEWDWTLALHKDVTKIHFRGMHPKETLHALERFDVGSSVCWSPMDKRMILEDMMQHHGSKVAFNDKLQRQLRETVVKESLEDSASKGISVRGLRKLEALLRKECVKGTFNIDRPAGFRNNWDEVKGISRFEDLKSGHVVYEWIRDPAITGGKRLADCPSIIDPSEIGVPQFMISHAYEGSIKKVFETIYSFFSDCSEDTKVWIDLVGIENFDDFSAAGPAQICREGTLVVADMKNVNPASRIFVIFDWHLTLKEHGRGALHLEGMSLEDRETLAQGIDSLKAECSKPEDKKRILGEIEAYHGSLQKFDDKLRLQVILKPLPYNVLHAEKNLLLRRTELNDSLPVHMSQYEAWLALSHGAPNYKQAFCIVSGPCTGKSTLSAKICESLLGSSTRQLSRCVSAADGVDREKLIAFHFLKSGDADSLDPLVIVKSIAFQLSPLIPKLQSHLMSLKPTQVDSISDSRSAIDILLSPLASYEGDLVVVIDGLDESDSSQSHGMELLQTLVSAMTRSTRFVLSTRSDPSSSFAHGTDVKASIRAIFSDSVQFYDPQPRYASCLSYQTVLNECHLIDHVPPLRGYASMEDLYKAFGAVFDRQPPRGQRMIDLVSILAASRQHLSVRMLEGMGFRRDDLEELPAWGSLFYSSNGRICLSRPLIDLLQSDKAKEFGVDLARGHALLGMKLLTELDNVGKTEKGAPSKYARDFALYHQCHALSAGGLDQGLLKALASAILRPQENSNRL